MTAVRVKGLVKRFETTVAVDGLELELDAGEVRGLLGPNGAGKTTLLRMLFGLVRPDAGSIALLGRPFDLDTPAPLEGVAGFVEEPTFYPYLSGRANLELLRKLDGGPAGPPVDEALARVDLAHRGGDRVSGYSTGMRQRLGIAAALLRSPRLLLLDEPTSGLDPSGARTVATLVRELAADGVAVLLSSHQIGELETVCDAFTFMRNGRVAWNGSAAQLVADAPSSAYGLMTSDDERALEIAAETPGVHAERSPRGDLGVTVDEGCLDSFVLTLGDARVSVRRLELLVSPLESMFFALTGNEQVDQLAPHELAERVLARP
ncbi:MAG: ABC transporter ATP-binding protein [Solirubrobacteraceae bacterium]